MYEDILYECGLTQNETAVYLALLKLGKAKSGEIVREAKISGGKIYETLYKLIEKGLVKEVIENGIKRFISNDPKTLLTYLEEKTLKIKEKKEQLEKIIPGFYKLSKNESEIESVSIIKNLRGISTIVYGCLEKAKQIKAMGLNSSKDENDVSLYDFILAYQKGETRCTLTTQNDRFYDINSDGAKQDNSAYFAYTVSCSDQFQKSYQSQRPFLVDLGIKDAVITVKHQIDNFANVNINYRRTGSFVIAKFDGKSWIKIFSGQQYPPCKLMFESGVPETVYEKCLN